MALKEIIVETQANLRADAANAKAVFSVDSQQVENLRSEAKIRQFSLTVDEPPTLGGSDAGAESGGAGPGGVGDMPGDHVPRLRNSARRPARERLGQARRRPRPARIFCRRRGRASGFHGSARIVTLKSSASQKELAKLKEVVDAHCPVLDILRAPVPVELELAVAPVAVAA